MFAVSLNDGHIFDIIFSDEYIMDIVGALECEFFHIAFRNHVSVTPPISYASIR